MIILPTCTEGVLSGKITSVSPLKRTWQERAMSPTLLNSNDLRCISYDDTQSIRERIKYCKKMGLVGFMVWELSQDCKRELMTKIINDYNE
jgi:GH18 family chitinase